MIVETSKFLFLLYSQQLALPLTQF
uniref:Uncharacterized protein n=1 Tax=Rhizophora mucronata TaxID=61149 RepID=A0A2P2PMX5_RHIMU